MTEQVQPQLPIKQKLGMDLVSLRAQRGDLLFSRERIDNELVTLNAKIDGISGALQGLDAAEQEAAQAEAETEEVIEDKTE